jgi:hypothetical protein
VTSLAIYGRTYLDAEVTVPLATLAEGKGKVDVPVRAVLGGFGCNAARALAPRFPAGAVRLATVIPRPDVGRLRASVPSSVELDALVDERDDLAWPAVTVIINPASDCKLLRAASDDDAGQWTIDRISPATLAASLHVVGRLPAAFVCSLRDRVPEARLAWCGGHALPPAVEAELDLACVNASEAAHLLGTEERSPRVLAEALAARARIGAARLVTGRANAPATVAVRDAAGVRLFDAAPPIACASQVLTLKGVGDVFAARFLATACFDDAGARRVELELPGALAAARDAAHAFLTTGQWA